MGTARIGKAHGSGAGTPGEPRMSELLLLARSRPELAWPLDADIASSRNAHSTNTPHELAAALRGEFDWLEGDVRLGAGAVPVMRHDVDDPVGVTLEEWLTVGVASGRGLKLDVKERDALPAVIAAVERSGVDARRVIINVGAWPAGELLAIRRALPDAIINLSPVSDADLSAADLAELQVAARIVGGRVMFPIRHDLVTPGVIHALRPHGRIAVWNTPALTNPRHDDVDRLRDMGVDGMIDLREPAGAAQWLQSTLVGGAASLLGWDAVHRALDALDLL